MARPIQKSTLCQNFWLYLVLSRPVVKPQAVRHSWDGIVAINLKHLTYFIHVAEAGSFTAAAEELHVSQPAVGKQVGLLEDILGVRLLERHARGIRLTAAGRAVMTHGKEIVRRFDTLEKQLRDFREYGAQKLELGVTPMVGRLMVNGIVQRVLRSGSNLQINIQQGYSDDLMRKMGRGEIDLTFSPEPSLDPEMVSTPLFSESFFLIGPVTLLGHEDSPLEFKALARYPLNLERSHHSLPRKLRAMAVDSGIRLNVALETDDESLRARMLLDLDHCTVAPFGLWSEEIEKGLLRARMVCDPGIERTLFLVSRRKQNAIEAKILEATSELVDRHIADGRYGWRRVADSIGR